MIPVGRRSLEMHSGLPFAPAAGCVRRCRLLPMLDSCGRAPVSYTSAHARTPPSAATSCRACLKSPFSWSSEDFQNIIFFSFGLNTPGNHDPRWDDADFETSADDDLELATRAGTSGDALDTCWQVTGRGCRSRERAMPKPLLRLQLGPKFELIKNVKYKLYN